MFALVIYCRLNWLKKKLVREINMTRFMLLGNIIKIIAILLLLVDSSFGTELLTINEICEIIKMQRKAIKSVDLTFSTNQTVPEEVTLKHDIPSIYTEWRILADCNSGINLITKKVMDHENREEKSSIEYCYDSETAIWYSENLQRAGIGLKRFEDPFEVGDPLTYIFLDKLDDPNQASIHSLMKYGKLRDATEYIDGHATQVIDILVDGNVALTCWIDPQRGCLPLKRCSYFPDGKIHAEFLLKNISLVQDKNGQKIWVPAEIKVSSNMFGHVCSNEYDLDLTKLRINPKIGQNDVVIRFAPGTLVNDGIAGFFYMTPDMDDTELTNVEKSDGSLLISSVKNISDDMNNIAAANLCVASPEIKQQTKTGTVTGIKHDSSVSGGVNTPQSTAINAIFVGLAIILVFVVAKKISA